MIHDFYPRKNHFGSLFCILAKTKNGSANASAKLNVRSYKVHSFARLWLVPFNTIFNDMPKNYTFEIRETFWKEIFKSISKRWN
jgi:hypothetical protein